MKIQMTLKNIVLGLCVAGFAAILSGCASTKVSDRQELETGKIPRPATIWVYDFAATAADIPAESALADAKGIDPTPQTPEQIAEGQKLGDQIATELVAQINAIGMTAQQASPDTKPQINDLVIRGYLLSMQEGNEAERVTIGFGKGASELKTAVEGFQMTANGLRKIGSGNVEAGGGKSPGAALGVVGLIATANPAGLIISGGMKAYGEESGSSKVEGRAKAIAKEIADVLKQRFTDQGWLN
jgi:Domain of unknown function (DUF4410)